MARTSAELRPQLHEAQQTLDAMLKEACAVDVEKANTGELIHVEEILAIANESAKKAISVRRRLKKEGSKTQEISAVKTSQSRVITDGSNVTWTVMAIHPTKAKSLSVPYQSGWLSFESGGETRRLAPIPDNWMDLPENELGLLAAKATLAVKPKFER